MRTIFDLNILPAQPAQTGTTSAAVSTAEASHASFNIVWSGVTGTADGTLQVVARNNVASAWVPIDGAVLTISGAAGSNLINLNDVLAYKMAAIQWTPVDCTGGVVDVYAFGKG
jgi:hypothetical protein